MIRLICVVIICFFCNINLFSNVVQNKLNICNCININSDSLLLLTYNSKFNKRLNNGVVHVYVKNMTNDTLNVLFEPNAKLKQDLFELKHLRQTIYVKTNIRLKYKKTSRSYVFDDNNVQMANKCNSIIDKYVYDEYLKIKYKMYVIEEKIFFQELFTLPPQSIYSIKIKFKHCEKIPSFCLIFRYQIKGNFTGNVQFDFENLINEMICIPVQVPR